MKREIQFLATIALAAFLVGCGGSDSDNGPNPPGESFYALRDNQLVTGDVNNLDRVTARAITGLSGGVDLVAIDSRPANGSVVALGSDNRLYRINTTTSAATVIGVGFVPGVSGTSVGFDFNPVVDRVRVVGDDGQNFRLNADTGVLTATDTNISDTNADIVAAAYTNNSAGTTVSTLYVIDAQSDSLRRMGGVDGDPSPNLGVVSTVGSLGVDVGLDASFDISADGTAYLTTGNRLYRVNLNTGTATQIGTFVGGNIDAFTIAP